MINQKQKSKKIVGTIFFLVAFCVFANATNASASGNIFGWIWGGTDGDTIPNSGDESGLGWISMNSLNCDTVAPFGSSEASPPAVAGCPSAGTPMTDYGVSVPDSSCSGAGCDLTGTAWSENAGWVVFNNAAVPGNYLNTTDCPQASGVHGCNAYREGNNIKGWARFASLADTNGPTSGWIHLYDTTGSNFYGLEISKIDGTGANKTYAWSDDYGSIDFSFASPPPAPAVTLNVNPGIINVDSNPDLSAGVPVTLTWTSTNTTGCTKVWGSSTAVNGSEAVSQTTYPVTYSITCTGPGGSATATTLAVDTACHVKTCSSGTCGLSSTWNYSVPNNTSCVTLKPAGDAECSVDSDCQARVGNDWKEVAP